MPSALQPVPMLDFSRAYVAQREEILAAITQVCDSQQFILGPAVERFETAAAAALSVTYAIGCSSGTDALWLALAATGVRPGDKVVTTPFSFFATASAILRAGATPVFADIDPLTFNLSPNETAQALAKNDNVAAILPVHLYGQCADMTTLAAIAEQQRVNLIEDAAQAFGAAWEGKPAGALGDVATFSFYPTKNLAAFGDAGLVTTSSAELDAHLRSLRAHGMKVRYFHDEVGWNARLDSIQAAVLAVKLRYVAAGNSRRRELAPRYDALFRAAGLASEYNPDPAQQSGIVLPWTDPHATHVFHQYVIRAPQIKNKSRDDLRTFLSTRRIGTEVYYPLCLHQQKALASLGYKRGDFPHAERAAAEVLALPMYPELREDEQQIVVDAIRAFYR